MKFSQMPYKRIDMEQTEKDFSKILREFCEADSGEKQFAVHEKFYALTDHVMTQMIM